MWDLATETLLEIFEYLESRSLFDVIQVNHEWFYCGISVLWRYGRCSHLAAVAPDRRQTYASVIQSLDLQSGNYQNLATISFPRLKQLSILNKSPPHSPNDLTPGPGKDDATVEKLYLKHYIRPGLKKLSISGTIDTALLAHINMECLYLREVHIYSPGPHVSAELFLGFLKRATSLERIILVCEASTHLVSDKTLENLAEHNNLEWVSLDIVINKHLIAMPNVLQPFISLQYLCINITQDAIPRMAEVAKSVKTLDITIMGSLDKQYDLDAEIDSIVLSHISRLTQLRSLYIFVPGTMAISTPNILCLKNLRNLKELKLRGTTVLSIMAVEFNDIDFRRLVSSLPRLRQLHLQTYGTQLTAASLRALGKYCKLLISCNLMGAFNMLLLKPGKAPLFPNLELFTIGSFRSKIDIPGEGIYDSEPEEEKYKPEHVTSMVQENTLQIARHFPKLKSVKCDYLTGPEVNEGEFSDEILESLRKILDERKKLGHG